MNKFEYIRPTTWFTKMYNLLEGFFQKDNQLSIDDLVGNSENKKLTDELIAEAHNSSYLNNDGPQISCFQPRYNKTRAKYH